jgi:sugar/nucleoside kinase (ribokinase family)
VTVDDSRPTGTCVVLVSPDGERSMVPDPGANGEWSLADVPANLWGPSTHLHVSGYALVNAGARDAALEAVRLAGDAGGTVSVDTASSGPLTRVGPSTFLSWIARVDVVLANADEASVLTGCADPADAVLVLAKSFPVVVVKLGADGALVATGGSTDVIHRPAPQVEVVDSTGAGDAFAAGFLPSWRTGSDLAAALDAGNALGARVVTQHGARP